MDELIQYIIGYDLITILYESSSSIIYRAIEEQTNRSVILKVLESKNPTTQELQRLKREYSITCNINSIGINKILSVEKIKQSMVIVEEDIHGKSLDILVKYSSLTFEDFVFLAIKITDSLTDIHSAKYIHKNINPSNIIWNPKTNQVKIIDFGIAESLNSPEKNVYIEGTLAYISPEQTGYSNIKLTFASDLYSLGVSLYEILTGRLPFTTLEISELINSHINKVPTPPSIINHKIPKIISDIIMKLLEKSLDHRYKTALEVKNDLEKFLTTLEYKTNRKTTIPKNDILIKSDNLNEEQQTQLFDSMDSMFQLIELIYDKNGNAIDYYFLQVNKAFKNLVGLENDDLIGKKAKEVFGIVEDYWIDLYEKVESSGIPENYINYTKELDKYFSIKAWKAGNKKVAIIFTEQTNDLEMKSNLKESEEKYRVIFDQATVGVAQLNIDGLWMEVNQKLCDIVGYTLEELQLITFQEMTHPDDLENDLIYMNKLLKGEITTYTFTKRYIKKSGDIIWVNLTSSLVRDKNNEPYYYIAVVEDITKEKLLSIERDYLAKFPSENPNPVFRISTKGKILYANNATNSVIKSWETNIMGNVPQKWIKIIKLVISNSETLTVEEDIFDKLYLFSLMPVKNEDYVNVYARDITEQNLAEKSLNKFKKVIEKIDATILITDNHGIIEYANPFFTELTKYSVDEYIGKNVSILRTDYHPSEFHKEMWDTISSGKTWEGVFYNRKKNGEMFCEKTIITPILNDKNKITNYVAIKTDITEDKKIEDQLRQSQKMEAIGQLAGGVAHDFNNMLTGIMGCAEIISARVSQDEELLQFTNLIMDTSMQAAELTKKLLSFSHKGKSVNEIFDIHEYIRTMHSMLERSIDKSIMIKSDLNAKNSLINGDKSLIQNSLLNLSLNARDAMPNGGELIFKTSNVCFDRKNPSPTTTIPLGSYIEIDVEDNGCGMTKEVQERLFEPFYTTKTMGKGTGLGLSIVYNTIKENRGHIHLFSELGHGSVFKILLPIIPKNSIIKDINFKPNVHHGNGTILVVDDENIVRLVIGQLITELGYNVIYASDGEECIKIYNEKYSSIDLVVLDMVMPNMNGRDVFYAIKEINPDVKVLISSGFSKDISIEKLIEDGVSGFIQKPYKKLELSLKIGGILT
ncbi:MAG: PAS domain S-box protein [Spirochaetaceae bacterium]